MKHVLKISVIILTLLATFSCSKDDTTLELNQDEILQIELQEKEAALKKFDKAMIKAQATIRRKSLQEGPVQTELEAQQLVAQVSDASTTFMQENGFTYNDYYEMFGVLDIIEMENRIAAAGILLYALQKDELMTSNVTYGKSKVGDCFLKAVGINATVEAITSIKRGGKNAVKKAFKKILKKFGAKLVPYLGQVLAAIEFVDCMAATQVLAEPSETDIKCGELLQFKLLNTNENILLSMVEVGVSVEIINPNKYYQTYEVVYGNGNMDIGDITTETPCEVLKNTGVNATIKGALIDKNSMERYKPLNEESNLPNLLIGNGF